ncbi:hypothetical protein ACVMAJ_000985 [Bradyrhizobium sp. USDA 4448]
MRTTIFENILLHNGSYRRAEMKTRSLVALETGFRLLEDDAD